MKTQWEKITKAVEGRQEDLKAWQKAIDLLLEKEENFQKTGRAKRERIQDIHDISDYIEKIYPAACRAVEVFYTMATVPVYIPVAKDYDSVGIYKSEEEMSFLPVFLTKQQAEEGLEYLGMDDEFIPAKVPFFVATDDYFGAAGEDVFPIIGFYDKRDKQRLSFADKYVVMGVIMNASETLRSDYVNDIFKGILSNIAGRAEQYRMAHEGKDEGKPSMPTFRGHKPPVS